MRLNVHTNTRPCVTAHLSTIWAAFPKPRRKSLGRSHNYKRANGLVPFAFADSAIAFHFLLDAPQSALLAQPKGEAGKTPDQHDEDHP